MKKIFSNKWVKFALVATIYVLWFVVWTKSLWMLLGLPIIFDIYITKFLARLVKWDKHEERKRNNKTYREVWSWIDAIVFALVFATLINTYFFQMYTIPTSSMEKTLLVGDYLYVSKATYGPRLPQTTLSLPMMHNTTPWGTKSYSEAVKMPYKRLAGRRGVERGDIVVFNFPAGDTVALERLNETYYDIVRSFESSYGPVRGRELMQKQYTILSRHVDKREHYVKRCVAVAGDTLQIVASQLFVNGQPTNYSTEQQYIYFVQTTSPIGQRVFDRLGIAKDDIHYSASSGLYAMPLTEANVEVLKGMSNVVSVTKNETTESYLAIFPNNERYNWTEDYFGPLWVPQKGATVALTVDNLPLYERIIKNYEGNDLRVDGDTIYINGKPATEYTFQMDYYFMMGDNRHCSADSRYWGFVPEDHVVGTPSFVWLSMDKYKPFPSNIRWSRMFKNHK